ncbi:hypothetical protein GOODEAATRI_009325 [Goodea atripinnis]|uniref:Uncharacterized protein n=1 Tax=Goodea atripinnis TaxID=208336 RepID=A0ABV0PX39_9TELE
MVTRREKLKRSLCKVQEQIFQHQVRLLDHELLNGDPSAKDLENLFTLGSLSSHGTQSGSSCSNSSLKSKRSLLKRERRKSSSDSPNVLKKDNQCNLPESKDNKTSRIKEAVATEAAGEAKVQKSEVSEEKPVIKHPKPEVIQERASVKLHKPESRKGPRREASGPEHEVLTSHKQDPEQEERGRKRRSDVSESFTCQLKNKFSSKHLDKTVSIRLVDIRNSDSDEYLFDDGMARRSRTSQEATPNTKFKAGMVSDSSKTNSWLRKSLDSSSHAPNGSVSGHLKGWGRFRIPKRTTLKEPEREDVEQSNPLLKPLPNTPGPAYPRTRLRTVPEAEGYSPDSKAAEGELEPCLKRCHSHELRGDSSLGRRYGSDIIRRGVLAS